MYLCNHCKDAFYESELDEESSTEHYEIWGSPYSEKETYYVCPNCGSSDLTEVSSDDLEECEECGDYFIVEYEDEIHCDKCKKKLGVEL